MYNKCIDNKDFCMEGKKCLAVVESKNEYYYEQAPYPVLETKRVIKVVTRAEKYRV